METMGDTIPMKTPKGKQETAVMELENLLMQMSRALVDEPNEVVINKAVSPSGFVAFEVWCTPSDLGALIGTKGSHANAMRTILTVAGSARRVRVSVQFLPRDGG